MSTPQGPNPPHGNSPDRGAAGAEGPSDQPSEQPAWGQQPPGGWGQQAGWQPQQGWDAQRTAVWGQQGDQQAWGQQPQGDQQAWGPPQAGQQAWGQQPTQQWGQQPQQGWGPSTQQTPAGKKKSALPWIVVAAVVVVLAVGGVVGFWKPGFFVARVFDQAALQNGVQQVLTRDYGHEVSNVICGKDIQVTSGATFTCDATVDGERLKVPVKVTSTDGNYEVGRV